VYCQNILFGRTLFTVSLDYVYISWHSSRMWNLDGMEGNRTPLSALLLLFETSSPRKNSQQSQER